MARNLILQNLMKLARGIGANPSKFMGTKTNITFLGKGPTKNPLFQGPLAGLEGASEGALGPRESMIGVVEDAMGFATANKLNSIQLRALELNLENIFKIYNPPVLPSASVTPIRSGIGGLRKSPKRVQEIMDDMAVIETEAQKKAELDKLLGPGDEVFGSPMKDWQMKKFKRPKAKDVTPTKEGKLGFQNPGLKYFEGAELAEKTASARATLLKLLDMPASKEGVGMTLREIMSKQDLKWLLEGGGGAKGDPIAIFARYFGSATTRQLPSRGTPGSDRRIF